MSDRITVAAVQFAPGLSDDPDAEAADLVRSAKAEGADIIILPELSSGPYFCKTQDEAHFALAAPWREHPLMSRLTPIACDLGLVVTASIFEREGPHHYNSVVVIDGSAGPLGVYRKSHIPDGPGYQEKFYFRPGNSGFKVWETSKGRLGVGICWDQWFPEAARAMALMGADILAYPTAIGAEPQDESLDTAARWRRAMVGHAVSNTIPVVAANRIGDEDGQVFYGTSFIADETGEIVSELGRAETGIITAAFDLNAVRKERAAWGFFRDRRPDLYGRLVEDQ